MKFKWTKIEQDIFNEIKLIMTCDNLLAYPNLMKRLIFIPMLKNCN